MSAPADWREHMTRLIEAGFAQRHIEQLLGVSHSPMTAWLAGTRACPLYVQHSLEAHALLLAKSPPSLRALVNARVPALSRLREPFKALCAASFLAASQLFASPAQAGILPLFVDAFVDGQQVFCFDTRSFKVGPMGSPPYRYEWVCAPGGGPPVTRVCFEPRPRPPFQFQMYVTDRYIALTCTATQPPPDPPPPPPPPPGLAFRDGFEPRP